MSLQKVSSFSTLKIVLSYKSESLFPTGMMTVSYQVVNLIDHKIVPFISEMFFTTNANDQAKQMKQQVMANEQLSHIFR